MFRQLVETLMILQKVGLNRCCRYCANDLCRMKYGYNAREKEEWMNKNEEKAGGKK